MHLKIVLAQIEPNSDKLLYGRPPFVTHQRSRFGT
jgi:hypothetical protein